MARGQAPPLSRGRMYSARILAGLTQERLAARVGTTRQRIIRYERGHERPEITRLSALATVLGVSVGDLVAPGALPGGIAGLRVEAGLTLAAGARALAEHLPPGVAANRASLSKAESGTMPLSWREAQSHVRDALAAAYRAARDQVASAWEDTFNPAPPALAADERFLNDTPPAEPPAEEDEPRAATVLVVGTPGSPLRVEIEGQHVGHMQDQRPGWAFFGVPGDQDVLPRVPEATTSVREIEGAVRQLLDDAMPDVVVGAVHGRHDRLGDGLTPREMERWELYRGRIAGREDVFARGRCWGWLQPADDGGFTAHTADGPVPGPAHTTRGRAVLALWEHLHAPLPPPLLGDRVHVPRTPREPFDPRPQCPYSEKDLSRASFLESAEKPGTYEVRVAGDLVCVVERDDQATLLNRWRARSPDGQAQLASNSRVMAYLLFLKQPGPLWADPNAFVLH